MGQTYAARLAYAAARNPAGHRHVVVSRWCVSYGWYVFYPGPTDSLPNHPLMHTLLRFRHLLLLLLGGLVILGLGGFFKVSHLSPVLADGSLLLGLTCVLLAKVLLIFRSVRWALRIRRRVAEA